MIRQQDTLNDRRHQERVLLPFPLTLGIALLSIVSAMIARTILCTRAHTGIGMKRKMLKKCRQTLRQDIIRSSTKYRQQAAACTWCMWCIGQCRQMPTTNSRYLYVRTADCWPLRCLRESLCSALLLLLSTAKKHSCSSTNVAQPHTAKQQQHREVMWSGDRSQAPKKATSRSTARICHTRMVLPAAAGRQGCTVVVSWGQARSLHCCCCCLSSESQHCVVLSHTASSSGREVVMWSGDRSQAPIKATSHNTARICHKRMVLPAGRPGCSVAVS